MVFGSGAVAFERLHMLCALFVLRQAQDEGGGLIAGVKGCDAVKRLHCGDYLAAKHFPHGEFILSLSKDEPRTSPGLPKANHPSHANKAHS
jgi:hypothetical protein